MSANLPARVEPGHEGLPAPTTAASGLPTVVGLDLVGAFLAGRKPTTLDAYRRDLDDFARFLGQPTAAVALAMLTGGSAGQANALALAYRADLVGRELAAATVARRLAALRSVVRLARTLGLIAWALEVEAPRVEGYRDTVGPGDSGWRAMLDRAKASAATGTTKGLRDLALIRLLHDLAMRRAEAVGLDLADVERAEDGTPTAVWILGKGRSARERLTLPDPVARDLAAWVRRRGEHPGPLFVALDPGAGPTDRLTGRGVHRVVKELGTAAGLARPTRPHGLRHQGITKALDSTGGDVRRVMRFSRHRKVDVLLRYDDNRRDVAGDVARGVSED